MLRGSKQDALDLEYNKSKISKEKEQKEGDKQLQLQLFAAACMNSWYNSAENIG
jgi:hypothetical protein